MPIDYAALRTEILTDPNAYGYAEHRTSGNDQAIADLLNLKRATIQIPRADISPREIWEQLDMADMPALANNPSSGQQSQERRDLAWLQGLTGLAQISLVNPNGTDTLVRTMFGRLFPAGTGTRTRLLALSTRQGSRAEQLFGAGTFVGNLDVAQARNVGGGTW